MKRAFTIIELLVVIGIIGILMGVLLGVFSGSSESARGAKCQANMRNLAMAIQSVGMSESYYPRASVLNYKDDDDNTITEPSWLSEKDQNDPYMTGATERRDCFEGGKIWSGMKGNFDSYVCPSHKSYAQSSNKGDPLWSYAMSSYFDGGATKKKRRRYGALSRADRYLLLAEVPYAKIEIAGTTIQSGNPSAKNLDSVLEYSSEVIGFNHKDGKTVMGHVCFADGHVEKLRAPQDANNIKDLTKWLCVPRENDNDFDIRFNGKQYEKSEDSATN